MKTRKLGLLLVALLVAMFGTAAVFSYVSQIEASTLAGAEPVDVLVAAQRIPAGTSAAAAGQGDLVQLVTMPRKSVPEGALTALDSVGAQTLLSDVFPGEVLLRAKFADQTARTGTLLIPKDKIAVSIELGDPQRVAGFVIPGSEVAIFVTVEQQPGAPAGAGTGPYTEILLPRASVIAVGPATLRPQEPTAKEGEAEVVPSAVLTLALTQDEAERLVHSTQTGSLYFGLLSTTSKTGPGVGVSNATLFQ